MGRSGKRLNRLSTCRTELVAEAELRWEKACHHRSSAASLYGMTKCPERAWR